jgi:hypothetical protein
MDWAAKELKVKEKSDWYNVTREQFLEIGGNTILNKFNYSSIFLFSTIYPDYNWLPWKFSMSTLNYWGDVKNQRTFMDWAAKELNVKEMSDWYKISNKVTLP